MSKKESDGSSIDVANSSSLCLCVFGFNFLFYLSPHTIEQQLLSNPYRYCYRILVFLVGLSFLPSEVRLARVMGNKKCDEEKRRLKQSPERGLSLNDIIAALFNQAFKRANAPVCKRLIYSTTKMFFISLSQCL